MSTMSSSDKKAAWQTQDKMQTILFLGEKFPGIGNGADGLIDRNMRPRRIGESTKKPQVGDYVDRDPRVKVLASADWDYRLIAQLKIAVDTHPRRTAKEWRVAISNANSVRRVNAVGPSRLVIEVLQIDIINATTCELEDGTTTDSGFEKTPVLGSASCRNTMKFNRDSGPAMTDKSKASSRPPTADKVHPMAVAAYDGVGKSAPPGMTDDGGENSAAVVDVISACEDQGVAAKSGIPVVSGGEKARGSEYVSAEGGDTAESGTAGQGGSKVMEMAEDVGAPAEYDIPVAAGGTQAQGGEYVSAEGGVAAENGMAGQGGSEDVKMAENDVVLAEISIPVVSGDMQAQGGEYDGAIGGSGTEMVTGG